MTSPRKRRKTNRRGNDNKRRLNGLLAAQDFCCHWCFTWIVRVSAVRDHPGFRLSAKNTRVHWIEDGKEQDAAVATVDHLRGVWDNKQIVAACRKCNEARGKQEDEARRVKTGTKEGEGNG